MRFAQRILWWTLLAVLAWRPWVLELQFADRLILVQWLTLALGIAWWLSQQGWRRLPHRYLLFPCLIIFLGYLFSTSVSQDHLQSFLQGQGLAFGMTLCAGIAVSDQSHRRQFLFMLVVTGTLLALHGLWQAAILFPAFEHFAWDQMTASEGLADFATQVIGRRRVFGPFPLPGLMAGALVILLPVSVAVLHPWATTSKRRILAIAVWGVQTTALIMTQSLGGIGSICVATLLVMRLRRCPWTHQLLALCITIACIGLLLWARPELTDFSHPRNPIVQRWRYWGSTVEMIVDHPIRGIGAGDYAAVYPKYRRPNATDTRFAHNIWLQVWAEWGILGPIGLLALFIGSIRLLVGQPMGIQIAFWAFWMLATIDITWLVFQVMCLWWPLLGLLSPREEST